MNRGLVIAAGTSAALVGAVVTWGIVNQPDASEPGASPNAGLITGASQPPAMSPIPSVEPSDDATTSPTVDPAGLSTDCSSPDVTVTTAEQLQRALKAAKPGQEIAMAAGTYVGTFSTTASGSEGNPITLCGPATAVIDGDGIEGGYGFHLDGAEYWVLSGFTVTNAQKGVVTDGTVGSLIEGLTVHHIGDEGIHLRDFSTDNVVRANTVFDTGNRRKKFGEGIYIGTANSNWCDFSDCKEDHSDRNRVEGNTIYNTTAESVDIKEGTSDGILIRNHFDGSGLVDSGGDSWVDVKGNDWVIEANVGVNSTMDGFQVHDVADGWGRGNVFRDNVATVNGPGFGFSLTPEQDNVVECSNTVSKAKEGYANVPCR